MVIRESSDIRTYKYDMMRRAQPILDAVGQTDYVILSCVNIASIHYQGRQFSSVGVNSRNAKFAEGRASYQWHFEDTFGRG